MGVAWEESHISAALGRTADMGSRTRHGQLGPKWEALAARATLPRDIWEGLSPFPQTTLGLAPRAQRSGCKRDGRQTSLSAHRATHDQGPLGTWASRGHCVGSAGGSLAWPPRAGGDETPQASVPGGQGKSIKAG